METVKLDYGDWIEEYKPKLNDHGDMIDFHPKVINGVKLEMLHKAIKENKCWTSVSADEGMYIVSGFRIVNRMDVFITEKSYNPEKYIEIKL